MMLWRSFVTQLVCICGTTDAFLFASKCVAPPPCTCSPHKIQCDQKHLTDVPSFTAQQGSERYYIDINMNDNHLTGIRQYAFRNLHSVNVSEMYINLQNNQIDQIENGAFSGIDNVITKLNLENNLLTFLPPALQNLTALQDLNVLHNPILSLDENVMSNIGQTLLSFAMSADTHYVKMSSFRYLKKLKCLTVDEIYDIFYNGMFKSFNTSLTKLVIYGHSTIPDEICELLNLTVFEFVSGVERYSISEQFFNSEYGNVWNDMCKLPRLTHLNLNNNFQHRFPKLASHFPNLQFLSVSKNELQYIEHNALEYVTSLTKLDLSSNKFDRIPSALTSLPYLSWLNMSANKIVTLQGNDLSGLKNLTTLLLHNNPLAYISPIALRNNPLEYIDLRWTNLNNIPIALMTLRKLFRARLDNNQIYCSCEDLITFTILKQHSVSIHGTCSDGDTFAEGLANFLAKGDLYCFTMQSWHHG